MSFGIPVRNGLGVGLMASTTLSSRGSLRAQATAQLNGLTPYSYWDFINNRALFAGADVGNVTNTPGWSFTRASTGYAETVAGVLVPFAAGELRRTDKGVLIEGARTNLALYSQELDNAAWSKGASSVTANAAVAPDGTTTADSLIEDTASSQHNAQQTITISSGVPYTASVFVKALGTGSKRFLRLFFNSGWAALPNAVFDLQFGTVGALSNATASITALANGWYRCTVSSSTNSNATSAVLRVGLDATGTNASYTGDGVSGLFVWGAQLEQAAFASSYIPTTTASATRAADVLTVSSPGVTYPLSLFAEIQRVVDTGGTECNLRVAVDNNNLVDLGVNGSDLAELQMVSGGASQGFPAVAGAIALATVTKIAGRFNTNTMQIAKAGTLGTEDTSATLPIGTPATIYFGAGNATRFSFGYLRRAAIFNSALSDANLQTVTT